MYISELFFNKMCDIIILFRRLRNFTYSGSVYVPLWHACSSHFSNFGQSNFDSAADIHILRYDATAQVQRSRRDTCRHHWWGFIKWSIHILHLVYSMVRPYLHSLNIYEISVVIYAQWTKSPEPHTFTYVVYCLRNRYMYAGEKLKP